MPVPASNTTIILLAEILIYGTLFLYGLRIGDLLHEPTMRVLIAVLFTLGMGELLGFIKLLFH